MLAVGVLMASGLGQNSHPTKKEAAMTSVAESSAVQSRVFTQALKPCPS